jgi:hypothetical protein
MSLSYYGPRIGLAPSNGDSAYCYVCEREGDKNDVIGCEYGHPRLIDLCNAIGVREKGKGKKKIKKRRQSKVFGEIPPAL